MKTTARVQTGYGSGVTGLGITPHWIMAITCVGFVVVGLKRMKLPLTTSNPERRATYFSIIIFNRHMADVIIEREVGDGNQ